MLQFPHHPLAIYQVSGEYAMLYHAAQNGVFDLQTVVMETVGGMRRAGKGAITCQPYLSIYRLYSARSNVLRCDSS